MILRRKPGQPTEYREHLYTCSEGASHVSPRVIEQPELPEGSITWNSSTVSKASVGVRFYFESYSFREYPSGARHRVTDFHVDVEWDDLLLAIERFAEHGHPVAKALKNALDLDKHLAHE